MKHHEKSIFLHHTRSTAIPNSSLSFLFPFFLCVIVAVAVVVVDKSCCRKAIENTKPTSKETKNTLQNQTNKQIGNEMQKQNDLISICGKYGKYSFHVYFENCAV